MGGHVLIDEQLILSEQRDQIVVSPRAFGDFCAARWPPPWLRPCAMLLDNKLTGGASSVRFGAAATFFCFGDRVFGFCWFLLAAAFLVTAGEGFGIGLSSKSSAIKL